MTFYRGGGFAAAAAFRDTVNPFHPARRDVADRLPDHAWLIGAHIMYQSSRFRSLLSVMAHASLVMMASCQSPSSNGAALKERPTPVVLNFDEDATGVLPSGWRPAILHGAPTDIEWQVVADTFAPSRPNALGLVRAGTNRRASNLCIWHRDVLEDVEVRLNCSGDYGAGIAFRLDDQLNGYVARVNPAEGNLRLFKLVDGERIPLSGQPLRYADEDGWYRLIVTVRGDLIHVVLEGYDGRIARRNEFEHRDESFVRPGRMALWTRADSLARFDDVEIGPLE